MIVPPAVRRKYAGLEAFVRFVGKEVRGVVSAYCEEKGYAFVSRFKTVESLSEKIESGRYACWSMLDDLYAATIVIPTLSDEAETLTFLRSRFNTVKLLARGTTKKAPDVFRYDATRFIGSLRETSPSLRSQEINRIRFEVQIRTAFEHAWSVTTHALAYKSPIIDWRRQRLAAQLKAAVEQLDTLVLAFDDSASRVTESRWPEILVQQQIATSFKSCVAQGLIPDELAPKDWSRFSQNVQSAIQGATRRAPRDRPPRDPVAEIQKTLEEIEEELKSLGPDRVPRSVSLFQLTLGILAKRKLISNEFEGFVPNVTDELREFFPDVRNFRPFFDYENPRSNEGSGAAAPE